MIVRWGLGELPAVLDEVGTSRPLLVASPRWESTELPVEPATVWREVPSHRIEDAAREAREADADVVVPLGGGSAIDLAKAIGAEAGLPLVSVPTTYAGAEWTPYFGVRDPERKMRGGGAGARLEGVVYEPELTLDLPREPTVGTALNALAHAAEALYARGHNAEADGHALTAAWLISEHLPRVVERPHDLEERTRLLEGACHAGAALGGSMLALGHAMAQAIGGRYGLPHGALNAICLPAALRFNRGSALVAIARFGAAMDTDDPIGRVEELADLGGFRRLRDLGVPEEDLSALAESAVGRAGNQANPKPATSEEIETLLRSVY